MSSLFSEGWKSNTTPSKIIENLIQLILRCLMNKKNQLYVSLGEFNLGSNYDMNEIFIDKNNILFKCFQESEIFEQQQKKIKLTKKYLVLSDNKFLLFSPGKENKKNFASLDFEGDLYLIEEIITKFIDENLEEKIKSIENDEDNYWKKLEISWRKVDNNNPKKEIKTFEDPLLMKIDMFFLFNDIISSRKKKILQNYEIYSNDFYGYMPIEEMDIYDESKLIEICMYNEKNYFKNNPLGPNFYSNKFEALISQQAKDVEFYLKKLIDLMKFKNSENVKIYEEKLKEFKLVTGV